MALAACLTLTPILHAAAPLAPEASAVQSGLKADTRAKAEKAVKAGADFLRSTQQDNGAWSKNAFPALTAFPVWALTRSHSPEAGPSVEKGCAYITSCVSDGGMFKGAIYVPVQESKGGGLINYNTAVCMAALHATGQPSFHPIILDARTFLTRSQYLGKQTHHGGMGYDPPTGRAYADLSNSYLAYEAMHLTRDLEDQRKGKPVKLNWDAAIDFIFRNTYFGGENNTSFGKPK